MSSVLFSFRHLDAMLLFHDTRLRFFTALLAIACQVVVVDVVVCFSLCFSLELYSLYLFIYF